MSSDVRFLTLSGAVREALMNEKTDDLAICDFPSATSQGTNFEAAG